MSCAGSQTKRHLDRFSRFRRADYCNSKTDRQTDHAIRSVTIGRTVTSRNLQTNVHGSIVNALYLIPASIRWKLSAFYKVQWLHFTGAVDIFVIVWCDISSGFIVPKIAKISYFLTELFTTKFKVAPFFGPPCMLLFIAAASLSKLRIQRLCLVRTNPLAHPCTVYNCRLLRYVGKIVFCFLPEYVIVA